MLESLPSLSLESLESLESQQEELPLLTKAAHPYLSGNFAPIHRTRPLTPCAYRGHLPDELIGGQYVRNGGNPVTNEDLGRDAHWFDGDGMLTGLSFRRLDPSHGHGAVRPEFVNQYILTDVYLSTIATPSLRAPILPSISTLVNPLSSLLTILLRVLRAVGLVLLSRLPGSPHAIRKISVANTAVCYHDGRALATCESGPPMRVALPGLETVGWFDGRVAEGEPDHEPPGHARFGQGAWLGSVQEWTTAHPRVDPVTKDLILFHASFIRPYVHYSVLPATGTAADDRPATPRPRLVTVPVAGVSGARMMHDFGVSARHTVILDLPLTLDPTNVARGQAVVSYDPRGRARYGVFPRYHPDQTRWFDTTACCIFHTANTWDEMADPTPDPDPEVAAPVTAVHMLVCRLNSASLVYEAGGLTPPPSSPPHDEKAKEADECRLYYYRFDLAAPAVNRISHEWALSTIPFEFPSVRDDRAMSAARFVYGCSSSTNFNVALGRAAKVDTLVKMDVAALIERGIRHPPTPVTGCVDDRSVTDMRRSPTHDPDDPIQLFAMPGHWRAQEPRFVPRAAGTREDDGWLLSYVFDESQLTAQGDAPDHARSELWILNATTMRDVVARVYLPQRVPYGLHGGWFSEEDVQRQRPVERIRSVALADDLSSWGRLPRAAWMSIRSSTLRVLA
ncbi:MAG: hypothetical protein M1826_007376 [Phylliscum demangeonii]|nr:MAG: hypothetical protein M1826_007376 [Phylliscum demangeonii]